MLEEMARHREFLRLAIEDPRLADSANRVPVGEWLAASGLTLEEQWRIGFGLSAMTQAWAGVVKPNALREHVVDLLAKLDLADSDPELPQLASSREEFEAAFEVLGDDRASLAWEQRPWKQTPFLRMENGDLLLLGGRLLRDWVGEGFHYRALAHAQSLGSSTAARYQRFMGEVVERYALDLAEAAAEHVEGAHVFGEQEYANGERRTSDVAVVIGRDLFLFEIHSRRVPAAVAVRSGGPDAAKEVTTLIVDKANQLGGCTDALLRGVAKLPGIDIDEIERIWPCATSAGHVMQTTNLWSYIRSALDDEKTTSFANPKVQAQQILDIEDYEKLLGLAEHGQDLAGLFERKTSGPFRDRDLAAWLHDDPAAPSDRPRMKRLAERWDAMGEDVRTVVARAVGAEPDQ